MTEEVTLKKIIDTTFNNHKPFTLKLKKYDINQKTDDLTEKMKIIQSSLTDLSKILVIIYEMWLREQSKKSDEQVYGDLLLAFVGDKIIRHWPNKELLFQSNNHAQKKSDEKSVKEHQVPISFFRDIFRALNTGGISADNEKLSDAFYYCLACHYRVVEITNDEDKALTRSGYRRKACRERYNNIEINIYNKDAYDTYEKLLIDSIPKSFFN